MSRQGFENSQEVIKIWGFNFRMTGLQAALIMSQMKRLPEIVQKKNRFNEIYRNELDSKVTFQEPTPGTKPCWWMTACLLPHEIDVEAIRSQLLENGIETRRVFRPLCDHIPYKDDRSKYPVAVDIYERGICLPSSLCNEEKDVMDVCKTLREVL